MTTCAQTSHGQATRFTYVDEIGVFGGSTATRAQFDPSSFTLSMSVLLRTLMNLRVAGCGRREKIGRVYARFLTMRPHTPAG